VERSKCSNCVFFKKASEWIGTPFKLRDCVKGRGADCVSAPFSILVDVGLLSRETFLDIYNARMLKLFRQDHQEFLRQLAHAFGDDYVVVIGDKSVKCGDIVVRDIGRYREMFAAVYVSDKFLVARPVTGVQWAADFEFDYKISKVNFRCPCEV